MTSPWPSGETPEEPTPTPTPEPTPDRVGTIVLSLLSDTEINIVLSKRNK